MSNEEVGWVRVGDRVGRMYGVPLVVEVAKTGLVPHTLLASLLLLRYTLGGRGRSEDRKGRSENRKGRSE